MNRKNIANLVALVAIAATVGIGSAFAHNFTGRTERINSLVEEGTITQEQADERLAHLEEKQVKHEEFKQEFADFLGVTVDDLKAAKVSGTTFVELAEANGVSEEDLNTFISSQKEARIQEYLDRLVADGEITQEEADERQAKKLERIESGDFTKLHRGGFRKGHGFWFVK